LPLKKSSIPTPPADFDGGGTRKFRFEFLFHFIYHIAVYAAFSDICVRCDALIVGRDYLKIRRIQQ
jgi:hypothetical protein